MKNIHIIPTDKPSRLWMTKLGNLSRCHDIRPIKEALGNNINIYITSDEEIKEGDWIGYLNLKKWVPVKYLGGDLIGSEKKIILTTDQNLIKDGVQPIDDEFLEWFVKNPSCEEVEVKQELGVCLNCECNYDSCPNAKECLKGNYKIIIPKEKPKQEKERGLIIKKSDGSIIKQETLKAAMYILQNSTYGAMGKVCDEEPKQEKLTYTEAVKKEERIFNSIMMKQETLEEDSEMDEEIAFDLAKEYFKKTEGYGLDFNNSKQVEVVSALQHGIIQGAKWQAERMYSEEDLRKAFKHGILFKEESVSTCEEAIETEFSMLVEQFKKK